MNFKITVKSFVTLAATFAATAGFATDQNLLKCSRLGALIGKCQLSEQTLAKNPSWDGQVDEVTYSLSYDFDCPGGFGPQTLAIGVQVGDSKEQFRFGESGSVTITGKGDLKLVDFAPMVTHGRQFATSCHLVITNPPTIDPSGGPNGQLAEWTKRSQSLNNLLEDGMDMVLLALKIDDIYDFTVHRASDMAEVTWRFLDSDLVALGITNGIYTFTDPTRTRLLNRKELKEKSEALFNQWESITSLNPQILNYYIILSAALALKENLPLPFSAEEIAKGVAATKESLVKHYKGILSTRITDATKFLDIIDGVKADVDSQLQNAKKTLRTTLSSAQGIK